ncbi:MAG: adaptor protein MecA [Clostridiales bacterium]|jgi:adapter protein MecA 1/2|nr:adaptor protein MecA [Clostridiales bacterium]
MKIEKITDCQLRILLSRSDLSERNIDLMELLSGSDKTQVFFKEMMEQASAEYNFQISNSPLVIEISPISVDSLMITITKMDGDLQNLDYGGGLNLLSELAKLTRSGKRGYPQRAKAVKRPEETQLIFTFETLDDAAKAAKRLTAIFSGESSLLKFNGKYYFVLHNIQEENRPALVRLENILSEYGQKQPANSLAEQHLKEHGDVIINSGAACKLAQYL